MVRQTIDQFLVIIGVIVIVVPVALMEAASGTLVTVLGGITLMGLGVWRLGHRMLPNRRVYVGLRAEVDHFIALVRKLNAYALELDTDRVNEVKESMHTSVDRMSLIAGHSDSEIEPSGVSLD